MTGLSTERAFWWCVRLLLNLIGINFFTKSKWYVTVKVSKSVVKAVYGCGTWL